MNFRPTSDRPIFSSLVWCFRQPTPTFRPNKIWCAGYKRPIFRQSVQIWADKNLMSKTGHAQRRKNTRKVNHHMTSLLKLVVVGRQNSCAVLSTFQPTKQHRTKDGWSFGRQSVRVYVALVWCFRQQTPTFRPNKIWCAGYKIFVGCQHNGRFSFSQYRFRHTKIWWARLGMLREEKTHGK